MREAVENRADVTDSKRTRKLMIRCDLSESRRDADTASPWS